MSGQQNIKKKSLVCVDCSFSNNLTNQNISKNIISFQFYFPRLFIVDTIHIYLKTFLTKSRIGSRQDGQSQEDFLIKKLSKLVGASLKHHDSPICGPLSC